MADKELEQIRQQRMSQMESQYVSMQIIRSFVNLTQTIIGCILFILTN